jgi:hypothetical protein
VLYEAEYVKDGQAYALYVYPNEEIAARQPDELEQDGSKGCLYFIMAARGWLSHLQSFDVVIACSKRPFEGPVTAR